MRFKGKVDGWFRAIEAAIAVLLLPILFLALREGKFDVMAITLAVFLAAEGLCASVELCNYVELREDMLYIAFGLVRKKVPYAEIASLSPSRGSGASLAASSDRIRIRRKGKGDIMIAVSGKHYFFLEISKLAPEIELL